MSRAPLDFHVLDAIANDADLYDDILKHLNDESTGWRAETGRPVQGAEVHAALLRLVRDHLVEVHLVDTAKNDFVGCGEGVWPPNTSLADMFFDLTGRGRVLYLNWES
jgi:hypothetical protein